MIDVHYWTTPNGHKVTIFLEEAGLQYKLFPVNIGKGEQFKAEFLAVSPNNRIPAIVDHEPAGGGKPISIFESGAILLYLADKTGKFIAKDIRGRAETIQWLFWQMGNLGPMAGQNNHFNNYAVEKLQYAMDRYRNEVNRLYGVMNKRLADRQYLAGEYSIADMASYPWIVPWERQGQKLSDFPNLQRWFEAIKARPAVVKAYEWTPKINPGQGGIRTAEERAILFGQSAQSVAAAAQRAVTRAAPWRFESRAPEPLMLLPCGGGIPARGRRAVARTRGRLSVAPSDADRAVHAGRQHRNPNAHHRPRA